MEWNVKNAVNRDVERQHLNKILKEIRSTTDAISKSISTGQQLDNQVRQVVTRVVTAPGSGFTYNPGTGGVTPTPKNFRITIAGDVDGSAVVQNFSDTVINVTLDPELRGIPDAPMDAQIYWRQSGQWIPVDYKITSIINLEQDGITGYTEADGWVTVELVEGDGIIIDNTNPVAPIISVDPAVIGGGVITLEAGETIHGRRAVSADLDIIYHPDLSVPMDGVSIVGIARQSSLIGDPVEVQTNGPMTDASWSWTQGPVYADDDGFLTQTAPTTGWVVSVGKAIASDTIDVNVLLTLLRS